MKLITLLAVFSLTAFSSSAQQTEKPEDSAVVANFEDDFLFTAGGSKPVPAEYRNIDGSPFISEEWMQARIRLDNNKVYENVVVRINAYDNKLHFRDAEGKERMLLANVKEIRINDPASSLHKAVFITGLAPDKNVFFKVLVDGPKIRLLEKFSGRKTDIKVFNGEPKIQFDVDKEVYFFSVTVKNMYKGTKKCAEIMEVFGNDKKVTDFVYKNGLRCHKKDEAIKLVEFYNSY